MTTLALTIYSGVSSFCNKRFLIAYGCQKNSLQMYSVSFFPALFIKRLRSCMMTTKNVEEANNHFFALLCFRSEMVFLPDLSDGETSDGGLVHHQDFDEEENVMIHPSTNGNTSNFNTLETMSARSFGFIKPSQKIRDNDMASRIRRHKSFFDTSSITTGNGITTLITSIFTTVASCTDDGASQSSFKKTFLLEQSTGR